MDVEEHPGGAVSNYIAISDVVTQMQERVNAMRACHSYYISLAYTQVWGSLCKATVLLSALHGCYSRKVCPHARAMAFNIRFLLKACSLSSRIACLPHLLCSHARVQMVPCLAGKAAAKSLVAMCMVSGICFSLKWMKRGS